MKRSITALIIALLFSATSFAQLTGTKTVPGDYPTVAAAIAALNSSGVGSGGVTFNVAAGYTETFATPADGYITTLTGSLTNPVTFIKSGAGANPVITASIGVGTMDAIIAIAGCDYVTFDGINLAEAAANVTATTQMEWGYAILKASGADGSQNITIKNCTINLTKSYTATVGIYSNNHTATSSTQLSPWVVTGANSNLKIFGNTISNCYTGIYLSGYADLNAPYAFYDQNNEIGKDGANIITNVAGQATIAGYGIYAKAQNNLKVANNVITSAMGGSGSPSGIYLTGATNASYDLYGNSVSMQYSGGTGTTAYNAIFSDMGNSGNGNAVNIYNNTVSGCTYTTLTSGNVYLMSFANLASNLNVYGNNVTNNIIGSESTTSTGNIRYLFCNLSGSNQTLAPVLVRDNLISNNTRLQSVTGGGSTYCLYLSGKGSGLTMYNNSVSNNVIAASGTAYLMYAGLDFGAQMVYNNTISNITQANGTTYGLYSYNVTTGSGNCNIYKNTVKNIEGLAATTVIYGFYSANNSPVYLYNNMISDFRALTSTGTLTSPDRIYGCYFGSGATYAGIYNNSIYLNAVSTGANFGTNAFYLSGSSTKLDIRNNLLINTSTPSGTNGKTNAIKFTFTSLNNFLPISNYNDLYAGTPGPANCIFYNGTTAYQTLSDYKTAVYPRDLQSVTQMPPFVNTTSGTTDLHLQSSVATQCESGGFTVDTPVAITDDFDNNPRFPNAGYPVNGSYTPNAPDMGADEFGGIPNDITAPAINYTALGNTYLTTNRTLTVTITDGSGVPTTGNGLPVLYWKINSGTYQSAQGTWVSGSTYTFSFGGGTTIGDIVSYYIAAQDLVSVPNVICSPLASAAGFTAFPPACSTPPLPPSTYTVLAGISGVYHVGVGKSYTTLTEASNDINGKFISGPLTLVLDDATYGAEFFPVTFTKNPGSSATNTLTIKPNTGVSPVITSSTANEILDLNGIEYMIIDGSNNGTNSKNLTISNSNPNNPVTIMVLNFMGNNPSTNVTIKNCKIKCIPINSSIASATPINFATTGGGFENYIITNNTIEGAFDAIKVNGTLAAPTKNIQITNNIIGSVVDADAVTHSGVYLLYADNTLISGNDIMGPLNGSLNVGQTGVYLNTGSTNTKIRGNKIHDFYHNSDDGWGASGIWYASDATTVTEISNNSIYDIKAPGINPGVGQNITYGIFFRSGGNVKILNNSINLTGPWLSTGYDASSACLGFYYQATGGNFEVRNNIFRNGTTFTSSPGPPNGRAYGIMISTSPTMFSVIDNNDFFIDGYNGAIGQKYTNGLGIDGIYTTLADWQAYTGQEANSVTIDPAFTTNTNLLPTNGTLNNKGFYLSNVPNDITGAMRSNPCDVGAYEFGADPKVVTLSNNSVTYNSAVITGSANAASTTFTTYFDYGTTNAYGTSTASVPASVTGSTNTPIQLSLSSLLPFTTYHYRVRGISSNGLIAYGVDSTFTTLPAPPVVITNAATAVSAAGATLNGSVNPNGGTATVTIQYGLTTAYGTTIAATPGSVTGLTSSNVLASISGLTPYTTYHFRVVATNVSGTVNGNDMTFTTLAVPATVNTLAATNIVATTATLNGSVNANYAPTDVTFEWGLTTAYGNTVNASPLQVTGSTLTSVSAPIGGLTTATVYHFRCVGNGPGGTVYGNDMVFTSDCPTPAIPGTITGPSTVCKNTMGVAYSVAPISGATGYAWTLPSGATIASGANTNSITVDFSASAVSGNISIEGTNSCGAGSQGSMAITMNELPVPTVNGPVSICQNTAGNVYTTEAGMTNYVWSVTGGTITAGAGTNSVTVTWNTAGTQTVNVNYANSNGCSAVNPVAYPVTVFALPVPTISGANVACESSAYLDYTTEPGMTNYVWDMTPNSGTISQTGTNVVTVFWTAPGAKWVSVSYTNANGCTASAATVYNVTVNPLPGTPGNITGQSTVCAGSNAVAYSVAAVSNATTYVWTLPAGASIATGAGTNSITVNYSATATSGNVSVLAQNSCGDGQASTLAVTVNTLPVAAGAINGESTICQGSTGVTYSVSAISGATGYNWTVPAGASIVSGNNTNSITVDFSLSAASGNVTVNGSNSCGNGTPSTMAVTVNTKPATPVITQNADILTSDAPAGNQWYRDGVMITGAVSQTYTILEDGTYTDVVTLNGCSSEVSNSIVVIHTGIANPGVQSVNLYPNPTTGAFWLSINTPGTTVYEMEILNSFGAVVYKSDKLEVDGSFKQYFDLQQLASGMYTMILRSDSQQITKKIVIKK
jgi:hypothetical protein